MRKFILAAGVATLAMASPALANPDKQGGGQGNRGGQSAKADRGGNVGQSAKIERRGGNQMVKADRSQEFKAQGKNEDRRSAGFAKQARGGDKIDAKRDRGVRDFDRNGVRIVTRDFDNGFTPGRGGGLINGCPPGLDKRGNGCKPPGRVKYLLGAQLRSSFVDNLVPYQYRNWYRDNDDYMYRSGDGFIYRVSRNNNLVDGIIPLFGGGGYYAMGDQWPEPYNFYNVPDQYRNYYADSGDYNYRYGDGAIYRVNSGSGVVDSIVALLAGDLGVGTQLPSGYDAYNVPFAYRDRYYDTADNLYRYNDGYIYQVDPKTRLISAVIDAIV